MNKTKIILASLALSLVTTGCTLNKQGDEKWQDPFFPSEDKKSSVDIMLEHTRAKGAAEDATLYAAHFDGDELNGLGQHKLALIVKGRQKNVPVTVYVNTPGEQDRIAKRVAMVESALGKLGVYGSDAKVEQGQNPKVGAPAAKAAKALQGDDAKAGAEGGGGAAPAAPAK
jgi:hypothetical protein